LKKNKLYIIDMDGGSIFDFSFKLPLYSFLFAMLILITIALFLAFFFLVIVMGSSAVGLNNIPGFMGLIGFIYAFLALYAPLDYVYTMGLMAHSS
jgi:hypothetical protein